MCYFNRFPKGDWKIEEAGAAASQNRLAEAAIGLCECLKVARLLNERIEIRGHQPRRVRTRTLGRKPQRLDEPTAAVESGWA